MKNLNINIFGVVIAIAVSSSYVYAKRSQAIDFEDEVVEGVNRLPLDSVTQLNRKDRSKDTHLYRKRKGFSGEIAWTLKGMEVAK